VSTAAAVAVVATAAAVAVATAVAAVIGKFRLKSTVVLRAELLHAERPSNFFKWLYCMA
jgi:hypothetical protein